MKSYNIVFLHRPWPICGGGETVTICNANEMVKRGHVVHVLYFKDSASEHPLPFIDKRIKQHKIDNVVFNENSKEFFVDKKEAAYVSERLIEYINANDIDIIINQWWPVEFLQNVRKQTKAKVIKCLHMEPDSKKSFDFNVIKGIAMKAILPLYRVVEHQKHMYSCDKYLKHSDLFVFLAPSFLDWYRARRTSYEVKIKTDYVFNPLVYKIGAKIDPNKKGKTVLFVGRLIEEQKKVTRILNAWKYIEEDPILNEWELQIVGEGPDRNAYENMISKLGLKHVKMEGFQQPFPFYQKSSIFLMTSAFEGLSMTLLEAQQNGVVCIGMDTYLSLHDVIINGKNGIIVENNNIPMFVEAIKRLMNNSDIRLKMAEEGYNSCKKFEVEKVVDRWESIFLRLTEGDSHKR